MSEGAPFLRPMRVSLTINAPSCTRGGESHAPPAAADDSQWVTCAFPALIAAWRVAFPASPALPFLFATLGPSSAPFWTDAWPALRAAQLAAATPPGTAGSIVAAETADLGDFGSPFGYTYSRAKQAVGARLAAAALAVVYGHSAVTYRGPMPSSALVTSDTNASAVVNVTVTFDASSVASGAMLNPATAPCPAGVPNSDPNNAWGSENCVGWRVKTGYPAFPPTPTYLAVVPGGFLGAGNDLPGSGNLTVAAAEAACTGDLKCVGFTFSSDTPIPPGAVNIYLKSAFDFSAAAGWQTYNSTRKPVGEWLDADSVAVAQDGKSVIVTVTLPNVGDTVVELQYGYGPWPVADLFNGAGVPASPFMVPVAVADGSARGRRLAAAPWQALQPLALLPLPMGSVRPSGWLLAQLQSQAAGQTGVLHRYYPPVSTSPWFVNCSLVPGGCQDTNGGEDGAYWLQAVTPLVALLNATPGGLTPAAASLLHDVSTYIDLILASVDATTGWIGPPTADSDGEGHWPRWPVMAALLDWLEAHPWDGRIWPALMRHQREATRRLTSAGPLGPTWAGARWQDAAFLAERMLDLVAGMGNGPAGMALPPGCVDPDVDVELLTANLWTLYGQQDVDWEAVFSAPFFATGNTGWNYSSHGVNTAQGLKSGAVVYRMNGGAAWTAASSRDRIAMLELYHGAPTGVIQADETLADSSPSHGSEHCLVVESMFSLNIMHEVHGDAAFAERAEKAAYNALPGTWTSDSTAHQYLQQANAIAATEQDAHIWLADGPDATTYGLAPNYPCCTANAQGWSRFVPRMVHATPDGGVALSLLGPLTATIPLVSGGSSSGDVVQLTVDTAYPFGDTLTLTLSGAPGGMPLYLRVPSWGTAATVAVNGAAPAPLGALNGTLARVLMPGSATVTLVYELNPEIYTDSVGIL